VLAPVVNPYFRKTVRVVLVVGAVLLVVALVYGLVRLLNPLSPLITAAATIVIAWYTLALRDSTNRLWKVGERQFELEGPFLQLVLRPNTIDNELWGFNFFDNATSRLAPERPQFYV
jgi:hypothetical protein